MNSIKLLAVVILLMTAISVQADARPYIESRTLSTELANRASMAAMQKCQQDGYQIAVAVVDRSGNLQSFMRQPLAGAHTVEVSITKARTAASFKTSTLDMMLNPRLKQLNYARDVLLIGGGLPIRIGGHYYGGIGVSGAPGEKMSGDIDDRCAQAGVDAIREDIEFAE